MGEKQGRQQSKVELWGEEGASAFDAALNAVHAFAQATGCEPDPSAWRRKDEGHPGGENFVKKSLRLADRILALIRPAPVASEDEIKAAYKCGWNDRESDIIERAERIAPMDGPVASGGQHSSATDFPPDDVLACVPVAETAGEAVAWIDPTDIDHLLEGNPLTTTLFPYETRDATKPLYASPVPAQDDDKLRRAVTDALRLVPNMPTVELTDDMLFKIETGETVTYGELKRRLAAAPASPLPEGGGQCSGISGELSGWQDISTAPKDGTPVLAWCVHPHARWAGDDRDWAAAVVTSWTTHNGGGWTWHGMIGTFTHWMPLPAAPTGDRP